ncbi:MAG: cobalamin-dependent protein [Deferrisomatales bacterium]|nr:cobalamin-dependent protein [Deferrisomatales bacterium]
MADLQSLTEAVVEMQEDAALAMTRELLAGGEDPTQVFGAYQAAMEEIGKRFERNEYFIPELLMSGEMMQTASEIIKPHLGADGVQGKQKRGKMVLATVQGDIHDIGKNIAAMMCDLNGVEVIDLGVDVPADRIVAEVAASGADIVGLSGLLTLAFDPMKEVVTKLTAAGLRDKVKVILGGGQLDEQVRTYVGADAFVTDAVTGVNYCKEWLG